MPFPRTQQYLQEIEERGYTVVPDVFGRHENNALKAALDRVFEQERTKERSHVKVAYNLTNKNPLFREAIQTPVLIEIMEALLGPDCILGSMNARVQLPGAPAQVMHRDLNFETHLPMPTYCNSVWMLDDFTVENGGTRFVPFSHLVPRGPAGDEEPPGVQQVTGSAGSLLVFDARLWHSGAANRSDGPRYGLHGFFCRSWMKPDLDHVRSIDPALLAEASPLLLRLWGFHHQIPVECEPGVLGVVPAPGVQNPES